MTKKNANKLIIIININYSLLLYFWLLLEEIKTRLFEKAYFVHLKAINSLFNKIQNIIQLNKYKFGKIIFFYWLSRIIYKWIYKNNIIL